MMCMMMHFLLLVGILLVSKAACSPTTQQLPLRPGSGAQPYLDGSFDELVEETLEYWKVPSISIAVIDGDDVYSKVFAS